VVVPPERARRTGGFSLAKEIPMNNHDLLGYINGAIDVVLCGFIVVLGVLICRIIIHMFNKHDERMKAEAAQAIRYAAWKEASAPIHFDNPKE
jgi:hypothetical protein